MAIERDTDKKLTVASVTSAKKAQQNLASTKKYTPPKPAPLKVTSRPQQNIQEMQPSTIPTSKIGDLKRQKSYDKFVPVTYEQANVKVKDPATGLEYDDFRAVPKYKLVFDTAVETVPKKKDAARLFYQVANANPEKARSLYGQMTERDLKAFWSYAVANGKLNTNAIFDDYKADREKYAGAEYYPNKTALEKHVESQTKKQIEIAKKAQQAPLQNQTKPTTNDALKAKLESLYQPKISAQNVSGTGMNPRALPLNLTPQQQEQQRQQYVQELQQAIESPNWKTKISAGIASGLTAGISEAGMTPEQRARYQQTVGTGIPYMVGQGIGMIGGGGIAEAGLKTAGKLAGQTLGKQVARGALIGGTQQGVMSATEGKTPIQIARDVALTAGLGAVADVGLNKLLGAIAKKWAGRTVTPEIKQEIENETKQAIVKYTTGVKKVMTPEDAVKLSEQVARDIEADKYYKQFDPKQLKIAQIKGTLKTAEKKSERTVLEKSLKESGITSGELIQNMASDAQKYRDEMRGILEDGRRQGGEHIPIGPTIDEKGFKTGIYEYNKSMNDQLYLDFKRKNENREPNKEDMEYITDLALQGKLKGIDRPGADEVRKAYMDSVKDIEEISRIMNLPKERIPIIRKSKTEDISFIRTEKPVPLKPPTTEEKPLGGIETLPTAKKPSEPIVEPTATNIDERTGFKIPKAEIQAEKSKMGGKISDLWDKFYSRFVNYNAPLKKLGGEALQTATVNKASTSGIIENILTNALVDAKGNKIGKSLKEVSRGFPHGENADLFEQYMRHKNNIDRATHGNHVYPDYTSEESAAWVKKMDELHPDWNAKQKEVTNWIDTFMKEWSVNRQLISPEDYQNLRNMYQNYVPTNREFSQLEKNTLAGVSGSKGFADQPGVIKSATGSNRNITPTIENIMNMVNRTVSIAKKNEVGQKILKATRENPNNLIKILSDAEAETANKNMNNIVSVFENGKRTYMQVNDPEIMRAINGMNNTSGDTLKAIKKLNHAYKSLITTKNVLFTVPNAVRDIQSSFINGTEKNPVKFANDLWNSYVDIVKNKEGFQQYKGLGGIGGNFTADKTKEFAKSMVKDPNLFIRALNGIEGFNNIVESAPRYAEFKRVLKATGDPQKALYAGYDITTNFSRGGDVTKQWDAFIPYLNAGVQGLDKMARQFGKHPFLTFAKGAGAITIPSIVLNEINKNNPNYQNLDNRTRDNYFVFSNPLGPKDENGYPTTFIKLPKERQMGMLFGSLVDRVYSGDFKDYGANTIANMAPTNPLTSNLAAPLYGLKANKSFTGADIVPRSLQGLSPHLQYDEKTSEIAKGIASLANKAGVELSPKQLDYLIKSYTGVIAQIGLPATTKSTYSGTSDVKNLMKPVVSRFTADVAYNNKLVGNFYDNLDEINKKVADAKKLNPQLFPKGFKSPTQVIQSVMGKYSDQISEMNKKAAAETDPNKQREYRMKALEIAKKANEYYQQAKSKLGAK